MPTVYYVDTLDELRLQIAEDMIREGEHDVKCAERDMKRRKENPRDRSLQTFSKLQARLDYGRRLRLAGYRLRDDTVVAPKSENPFNKEGRQPAFTPE